MSDPFTQLSDKELEVGYWWTTHRIKIKAILIIIVIVALVALYANAGWRFYVYLSGTAAYEQMLVELTTNEINYAQIKASTGPKNLVVHSTKIFASEQSSSYNILAEVENINQRWWLKQIKYQFNVNGELTDESTSYILPGEKKYLYYFNHEMSKVQATARLIIKREIWYRVKDSSLLDSQGKWYKPDFLVNDLNFVVDNFNNKQSKVNFNLANFSPYNFWEVKLQVLLWQGQKLKDFNVVSLDKVAPGDDRSIEVMMSRDLSSGLRPEVIVSANSMDEGNLRNFGDMLPSTVR